MDRILSDLEIGQKIRALRLQAGLTQEKLAEKLGITFQQVQKYEKGVTKVNLQKLQQLAKIMKVPPASFFDDSSCCAYQLADDEMRLLHDYRNVNLPTHKESIQVIIAGLAKLKP